MRILYAKTLTRNLCGRYPDYTFVFGDNLKRKGCGGQAVIRYEPNSFGIPTKREPATYDVSFFSDAGEERAAVLQALRDLYVKAKHGTIVFPADGIGTGLARMRTRSPKLYKEMCEILETHFGIINGQSGEIIDEETCA